MSNEYTPSEAEIRDAWDYYQASASLTPEEETLAEFDRAIAKIKADAWEEAANCAPEYMPANPYLEERA